METVVVPEIGVSVAVMMLNEEKETPSRGSFILIRYVRVIVVPSSDSVEVTSTLRPQVDAKNGLIASSRSSSSASA